MPTRALRRARKEKDKEALLSSLKHPEPADGEQSADEDDESEDDLQPQKPNLFAMLNAGDDDEDEDEAVEEEEKEEEEEEVKQTPKKKSRKKKKKKGKATEEDEIDVALKALELSKKEAAADDGSETKPRATKEQVLATSQLAALLKIDNRNLDPDNEMRRLFGRAALSVDDDAPVGNAAGGRGARRGLVPGAHGRGLQAGKRNVFVQPGEGWPPASSGGLGMEVVSRNDDGSVEFKYVHNDAYKDVQGQFLDCVTSMDPQRMVLHLQTNPYHISTLLQVSTIALTHNNPPDHPSSQILVSRALYALGRSSHSTFPQALNNGFARLNYDYFENRELWYTGWKYIESLTRRALWRTALEMARVLLQLDPTGDPLCMALCIDQYALKCRQAQMLVDLYNSDLLHPVWSKLPNMVYSVALAQFILGNQEECRKQLKTAITKFPWMVTSLCSVVNLDVPQQLWGVLPPTDEDRLLAEMYTHRCGDVWHISENTTLLFEVAGRVKKDELEENTSALSFFDGERGRDIYRHVILMEVRNLLTYLPANIKSNPGMAWDPLPPPDHISEYQREMVSTNRSRVAFTGGPPLAAGEGGDQGALGAIRAFVTSLMPWAGPMPENAIDAQGNVDQAEIEAWMTNALREAAGRQEAGGENAVVDEAWMGNMLELNGEAGEALRRAMREQRREQEEDDNNREGGGDRQ